MAINVYIYAGFFCWLIVTCLDVDKVNTGFTIYVQTDNTCEVIKLVKVCI